MLGDACGCDCGWGSSVYVLKFFGVQKFERECTVCLYVDYLGVSRISKQPSQLTKLLVI